MKKLRLYIPMFLFLVGVLFGCTQNSKDADTEAVKEVFAQYFHAVNTNDMDLFIACWADDAKRMERDFNTIVGKEKIQERFQIFFDYLNMNIKSYGEIEVEVDGDLAFSQLNVLITSSPKEGGPTTNLDLKVLDLYKRQADGSWKIYIDCISENPTWSNETISPELLKEQDLSDPAL